MAIEFIAHPKRPRKPRPLVYDGDIAYVPMTRGALAKIDSADAHMVEAACWSLNTGGYARSAYDDETGRTVSYYMHRVIAGAGPDEYVDHIDGDRLNNTRANLRICSMAENLANRGAQINNKTGFKGVSFCRLTGRYRAILTVRGETFRGGRFDTPEQAARAYDELAKAKCGDFARLNFP